MKLRDTKYATELARATVGEARIERLKIKETGIEEIRFSWWPSDKLAQRPLDLPEEELLELLKEGFDQEVFSKAFKKGLQILIKE